MPTIGTELTDETLPRVRQEAIDRGFATPEAYLQSLVADDLRRRDQQRLEAVLVERIDSGLAMPMDDAGFRDIHNRAAAKFGARLRA